LSDPFSEGGQKSVTQPAQVNGFGQDNHNFEEEENDSFPRMDGMVIASSNGSGSMASASRQ